MRRGVPARPAPAPPASAQAAAQPALPPGLAAELISVLAAVRLPAGQHHALTLPIPPTAAQMRKTPAEAVTAIDELLDHHTHAQIAGILNARGLTSGEGRPFHRLIIRNIRDEYGLACLPLSGLRIL